jgi:hypothetical protein
VLVGDLKSNRKGRRTRLVAFTRQDALRGKITQNDQQPPRAQGGAYGQNFFRDASEWQNDRVLADRTRPWGTLNVVHVLSQDVLNPT